jgi:hypothetical protein
LILQQRARLSRVITVIGLTDTPKNGIG